MSKRGAAAKDNNKRSKKTDSKDIYGDPDEMVKTMSFNRFPVLVTLTAFLAFALLFVYSQGGHERVLRWVSLSRVISILCQFLINEENLFCLLEGPLEAAGICGRSISWPRRYPKKLSTM